MWVRYYRRVCEVLRNQSALDSTRLQLPSIEVETMETQEKKNSRKRNPLPVWPCVYIFVDRALLYLYLYSAVLIYLVVYRPNKGLPRWMIHPWMKLTKQQPPKMSDLYPWQIREILPILSFFARLFVTIYKELLPIIEEKFDSWLDSFVCRDKHVSQVRQNIRSHW